MTDQTKNQIKLQLMHSLALQSRSKAYCPYSKFAVGACILAGNGQYYSGCNVQRSVGSVCAEGTAIVKMVESGCRQIKQVYVITQLTGGMIAAPCGFCRQFIKQFSKNDDQLLVHLGSVQKGYQKTIKFSILLPYSFGPNSLGIKSD